LLSALLEALPPNSETPIEPYLNGQLAWMNKHQNFISYLKDRFNFPGIDLPPDLVIKLDVTIYTDANDYLLRVPEVWLLKPTYYPCLVGKRVLLFKS